MKIYRFIALLALLLALCVSAVSVVAEEEPYSHVGETLPDFTVTTIDGGTFTLSEALKEKDMVMINLWATWCGPCEMEFPYMEEAYEQYSDKVEIVALSVEPEDTVEVLQDYVDAHGMTFPVGSDTGIGLGDIFANQGIPTTLVVDRFGVITFIEVGSQPSAGSFTRVFDAFIGDDYTESVLLDGVPPMKPNVEPASEAELTAALNAEGGAIAFRNAEDELTWPMLPAEKDGRSAVASTNAGCEGATAAVIADVTIAEGEALAFDFATSTESGADVMIVDVDGEHAKVFGGEHGWTSWILDLEAGAHEVTFSYVKDDYTSAGEDCVWLDEVRLVSGGEADALRAALPVYPVGDAFSLKIVNDGAKEIIFEGDDDDLLTAYFMSGSYWIVPDETAEAEITLTADLDPEAAYAYNNNDGLGSAVAECLNDEGTGFFCSSGIDTMETTGYSWTNIYAIPRLAIDGGEDDTIGVMFFADEENVNAFVEMMAEEDGLQLTWRYADGTAPATTEAAQGESAMSTYTVTFVDQNGDPVPGCIINFCTDETCVPTVADENGVATFEGAPYAYHLQVIKVPAGYEFDTTQEFYAEEAGGELSFTVTKP